MEKLEIGSLLLGWYFALSISPLQQKLLFPYHKTYQIKRLRSELITHYYLRVTGWPAGFIEVQPTNRWPGRGPLPGSDYRYMP